MDISMTSTTNDIPGYCIVRNMVGGRIHEYVVVCEEAREEAFDLLMQHVGEKGANAIIGVRYDAAEMSEAMTEVLAYGTAVVVERV